MRFETILDFLTEKSLMCPSYKMNCVDYYNIFGSSKSDMEGMIMHAIQLVEQLETQCTSISFSKYYMTLNGNNGLFGFG